MGFSSWPVDAGSGKIRPVRFLGKIFSSCYSMTTKNSTIDKEMSIKVDLRDKYDRKALSFINGNTSHGLISIKKAFVDRRRKYSSTVTSNGTRLRHSSARLGRAIRWPKLLGWRSPRKRRYIAGMLRYSSHKTGNLRNNTSRT